MDYRAIVAPDFVLKAGEAMYLVNTLQISNCAPTELGYRSIAFRETPPATLAFEIFFATQQLLDTRSDDFLRDSHGRLINVCSGLVLDRNVAQDLVDRQLLFNIRGRLATEFKHFWEWNNPDWPPVASDLVYWSEETGLSNLVLSRITPEPLESTRREGRPSQKSSSHPTASTSPTYEPVTVLPHETHIVPINDTARSLRFSEDGEFMVVQCENGIRVFHTRTWSTATALTHGYSARDTVIEQRICEGKLLLGQRKAGSAWQLLKVDLTSDKTESITDLAFIPLRLGSSTNGSRVYAFGEAQTAILEYKSRLIFREWELSGELEHGANAFMAASVGEAIGDREGRIRFYEGGLGTRLSNISPDSRSIVRHLIFTHNGQVIVSANERREVKTWILRDNASRILYEHSDDVVLLANLPESTQILSAAADGRVVTFDLLKRVRTKIELGLTRLVCAGLHPGGQLLAFSTTPGKLELAYFASPIGR